MQDGVATPSPAANSKAPVHRFETDCCLGKHPNIFATATYEPETGCWKSLWVTTCSFIVPQMIGSDPTYNAATRERPGERERLVCVFGVRRRPIMLGRRVNSGKRPQRLETKNRWGRNLLNCLDIHSL